MKRLAEIAAATAFVSHALGALMSGSLNPAHWPALLLWAVVLIITPCVGLAVSVVHEAVS